MAKSLMYLWKSLDEIQKSGSIRFANYFKSYSFIRWAHKLNLETIKNPPLNDQNIDWNQILADLTAAVITSLFENEKIKRERLVEESLKCCRALLYDDGYALADIETLVQKCRETTVSYILVAGCQSELLLDARVRAAAQICEHLIENFSEVRIVFSGASPTGKVEIPNESLHMKLGFTREMEERETADYESIIKMSVILESKSSTSKENIELFAKEIIESVPEKPISIVLVSSNFHLMRLSKLMIDEAEKHDSLELSNIILVGSEDVYVPSDVSMLDIYVKSMLFEMIYKLYSLEEYWHYGLEPKETT